MPRSLSCITFLPGCVAAISDHGQFPGSRTYRRNFPSQHTAFCALSASNSLTRDQTNYPPVVIRGGTARVSHAQVLKQCSQALCTIHNNNGTKRRLFTLDFPPERSETRGGTLVSRYENNINFMEKLLLELGTSEAEWRNVGGDVSICDNVNPQGGGEYLTDDECMVGRSVFGCQQLSGKGLTMLINAGVDASTLRQVEKLDDGKAYVVLINCGLERVSWFAKMRFAKYIEQFDVAYYLKNVTGNGWLIKMGDEPWRVFVLTAEGMKCVKMWEERPKIVDVEAYIRIFAAQGS